MYILANHLVKGYFWTHARDRSTPFLTAILRSVGHGWGTKIQQSFASSLVSG